MMDDTHEIYKWGGVWRFADFGVATYYVANVDGPDGNALPPVSGGDWRVTAGTSPPPDLTAAGFDTSRWVSVELSFMRPTDAVRRPHERTGSRVSPTRRASGVGLPLETG